MDGVDGVDGVEDVEDVESQVLAPVEGEQEEQQAPPQVITYGGEDGENGGALPSRQRFNENGSSSSAFRRGKGERLAGPRPRRRSVWLPQRCGDP